MAEHFNIKVKVKSMFSCNMGDLTPYFTLDYLYDKTIDKVPLCPIMVEQQPYLVYLAAKCKSVEMSLSQTNAIRLKMSIGEGNVYTSTTQYPL